MLVFTDENSNASVPYNSYTPSNSVPRSASMTSLTDLKSNIDSFAGNYRGILFAVDPGTTDGRGVMQTMYDALNESTGSSFELQSNSLLNYTSQVSIGNPIDANQMFGYDLINDGDSTPGYYTEIVVNALIGAGYSIAPYCGGNEIP